MIKILDTKKQQILPISEILLATSNRGVYLTKFLKKVYVSAET